MQGCELLVYIPVEQVEASGAPALQTQEEEIVTSNWTLHTPPLRYEVASMQHWLDLNA
jgi:hypothetical protein